MQEAVFGKIGSTGKTKKSKIRMIKPVKQESNSEVKKEKRLKAIESVRKGFLRLIQTVLSVTAVILVVYLTATVLLPVIGGTLSDSVGLSGQTHFYNMLQSWGVPMLFVAGISIVGDVYLCKHILKTLGDIFQTRIDAGLNGNKKTAVFQEGK